MVIVIGSAPLAIGSADKKHRQSAILLRASLLTSVFMTPAYGPGTRFGKLKVTRRTGMLRNGLLTLRVGFWRSENRTSVINVAFVNTASVRGIEQVRVAAMRNEILPSGKSRRARMPS